MIELLGKIPRHYALSGKYAQEYFTKRGTLVPLSAGPGSGSGGQELEGKGHCWRHFFTYVHLQGPVAPEETLKSLKSLID